MTPTINSCVRCPACYAYAWPDQDGQCAACGNQLVSYPPATPPKRSRGRGTRRDQAPHSNRGTPYLMSSEQVAAAYRLYQDHGLSLRQVAAELFPQTEYRSEKSLAVSLCEQWRWRGWPLRDRVAATVTASHRHGKGRRGALRDRAHTRELRVARGEIRGVQCAGTKQTYPDKGRPCRRPALAGSDYCLLHSPEHRDAIVAHTAAMRLRVQASAVPARSNTEVP